MQNQKKEAMKTERTVNGYCIQSGDKFVNIWEEPQFTSYYLGEFNGVHIFRRKKDAEEIQASHHFPNAEIKEVQITMITELI